MQSTLPLVSGDLELFGSGPDGELWRAQVERAIASGRTRPEWVVALRGAGGERLAAASYWSPGADADVAVIHHLDAGIDPALGADLLCRSVPAVGASRVLRDIDLPVGARPEQSRAGEHEALLSAGFVLEVERLELLWEAGSAVPVDSGRLCWRPARDLPAGEPLAIVRRVADGSLDHDTRTELAAGRGDQDAREAYDYFVGLGGEPDWFAIGYVGDDPAALLVVAGAAGKPGLLEYVGVLPEHRGNGYVDDVVARATALLNAAGVSAIRAGTDTGNAPMAAAFARAGYAEVERVFRYYWRG
jgi:ribosomal protein S18 acetylase RimI-like enzyme